MIKLFVKIDKRFNEFYEKASRSFLGKISLKLLSEVLMALLIALAVYLGTLAYEYSKIESIENEKLNKLYISVSNDYVESLFGEPYIKIQESDYLQSQFYLLKDAVLRTVTDNNNVVAFFITAKDEKRKIPILTGFSENQIIGKSNFYEVKLHNPLIESNQSGNGFYGYYVEMEATGRYGMFNYYLFATVSYGFIDDASSHLTQKHFLNNSMSQETQEVLRKKAKPNTFGVIADGYEEMISIIPFVDEWENIYYLLIK